MKQLRRQRIRISDPKYVGHGRRKEKILDEIKEIIDL